MKPFCTAWKPLAFAVLAGAMLLIVPHGTNAARSWQTIIPPDNDEQMVQMRIAGVQRTVSQVPFLIKSLQQPPGIRNPNYIPASAFNPPLPNYHEVSPTVNVPDIDNEYRLTLMHALAQMGSASAVPEMDNIIQSNKDPDVVNYAKVCKARVLAESSVPTKLGPTPKALSLKVERFLTEMGMTAADLNAGAGEAEAAHREFLAHPYSDGGSVTPVGLLAMREVADILYRDGTVAPASVPALKGIEFERDAPSALKMRLAPLTRQRRVDALIQDLSTDKVAVSDKQIAGGFITQYQQQLLCDEGLLAKKALAAVLMPPAGSANGRPVADKSGDLTNTYNNIAGDGSVPLVLSGGWQSDMTATRILRRQFVTEY